VRLLDLFCGAGGAGMGYHRAGFEIVGVDIKPQKHYPFEFHLADAFDYLRDHGHEFDVIHASPPCQAFSALKNKRIDRKCHANLIAPLLPWLIKSRKIYVIENVVGAPLFTPTMLCGSMFGLKSNRGYLQRHRLFESNALIMAPGPCLHNGKAIGVYGHGSGGLLGMRTRTANADESRELMGMPWATRDELSQAIPPAYTEWIGKQLMRQIRRAG
jgi:DNA (cytosine-5)-methyltransferase 1